MFRWLLIFCIGYLGAAYGQPWPAYTIPGGFCEPGVVGHCKKNRVSISVLNDKAVTALYKEFAQRTDLAYEYKIDGCYARAYLEAKSAEEHDEVIMGKVFIHGILRPLPDAPHVPPMANIGMLGQKPGETFSWQWHVATVVFRQNSNGRRELVVLDPSIAEAPLTVDEFKQKLLGPGNPPSRINDVYFGSRFQYKENRSAPLAQNYWYPPNEQDALATMTKY